MVCLACGVLSPSSLCGRCRLHLRAAPEQALPGVGVVSSGFRHEGPARTLVHHLKYRGVVAAGRVLAEAMAPLVPPAAVLVPVVRVGWRRLKYGVDPAVELCRQLSRLTGRPVVGALAAPLWGRARAGGHHGFAPRFRRVRPVDGDVVLVDDVVTTGSTLVAAAQVLSTVTGAVTATSSIGCRPRALSPTDSKVTSLVPDQPEERVIWKSWSPAARST